MLWSGILAAFAIVVVLLLGFTTDKPRKKTFLPWLDVVSYTLTSATVLTLVLSTQSQINQTIMDVVGPDLHLSASRSDLERYLLNDCGSAPECLSAARAISTIANPRGTHKDARKVSLEGITNLELRNLAVRYNAAFDRHWAANSVLFSSLGFWVAIAVICGMTMGLWRRVLVLLDARKLS